MVTTNEAERSGPEGTPFPLPTPPEFPVSWDRPEDASLLWTPDLLHWPDPITSLDGELVCRVCFEDGISAAAQTYDLPLQFQFRRINTYAYMAVLPPSAPPEELEAQGRRSQEKLAEAMAHLAERWESEWLPEIQRHLAYWETFDLRGATMPQLLAHMDQTIVRNKRLWEIHMLAVLPSHLAASMFADYYRDLFGDEDTFAAFRLVQGFDNKILETDRALWQLSRKALDEPEVRRVLEEHAAADVPRKLKQLPQGQAFLADLHAFLTQYGHRGDKMIVSEPSWIEDPTPVIENLKNYIAQADHDPEAEMAARASERERLVAEVRKRLNGYPAPAVGQFEFLLKAAQEATVLEEEHNFWIDYSGTYQLRRVLQEFGRRFAEARVIERPDDVFYLTLDELRTSANRLSNAEDAPDRHQVVAERKAEVERFRSVSPPPALGTLPPGAPPDNPLARALGKFFGGPPQPMTESNILRGNAGSPGKIRGPAKVIRSLAEAEKLQPGDILVAETTAPPWTPLFATAAAVVTDAGGILSHGAVVAREYGIPAVVGVGVGTMVIQDEQLVEVDGDAGVVKILTSS